jgi:hypothetical protein
MEFAAKLAAGLPAAPWADADGLPAALNPGLDEIGRALELLAHLAPEGTER